MKIKSLHLKNFRCFKEFDVVFNAQTRQIKLQNESITVGPLTVIVAKNGNGKTSVLDAIRIVFGTFTSAFDYPSAKHIDKKDIHIETPENTIQSVLTFPVGVHATGEINNADAEWYRELSKEEGKSSIKNAKVVTEYGKYLKGMIKADNANNVVLPLIAFYGTGRLWKDHKNTEKDRPLLRPRDYGYDYALGDDSNYLATNQWLTNAIEEENNEKNYSLKKDEVLSGQLEAIRAALNLLLKEEGYLPLLHINQKYKTLAILSPAVSHPDGSNASYLSIPVSYLSDGVRCAFSLVTDIAFRCAKLNPNLGKNACKETSGIVLIDEVDLHLHPAWQQKILNTLQLIFPNIQFIVTTHSPQVVSSVPAECVRIIDNGEVVPFTTQTQGVETQDILAQIFGTDAAPAGDAFVKMLDEYAKLEAINQADSEYGRNLRQQLTDHFGAQYGPLQRIEIHRKYFTKKQE